MERNKTGYEALYRVPFENEKLCTLICHILKKEIRPKENQDRFDNDRFVLTMKIVKLNPEPLHLGNDLKQGKEMVLDIFHYGREIDRFKNGITNKNMDVIKTK